MKWITFSRKMGTNGTEVATRVANGLGYPVYDTKAINHMAEELGILGSVREVDEKVPSMLHRVFSHAPMVYLERLYSVIYELARQGKSHPLARLFLCPARSGDGIAGDLHSNLDESRTQPGSGCPVDQAQR